MRTWRGCVQDTAYSNSSTPCAYMPLASTGESKRWNSGMCNVGCRAVQHVMLLSYCVSGVLSAFQVATAWASCWVSVDTSCSAQDVVKFCSDTCALMYVAWQLPYFVDWN
mmetsp:Transcript_1870/g.4721  ORF Transcript_1870/g.4721 Transcript_1870/m.4721 type:complete len:110 (-) Transcript_1870:43-372(-)